MTDEVITNEVKPEVKPEAAPVIKRDDRNTVFIGSKPFMNYVTAVVMQFTTQNANKVTIRSRGKFISKAVDVAEVVKRRFMFGQIATEEVKIGSEAFENQEGRQVSVSTIDIALMKFVQQTI